MCFIYRIQLKTLFQSWMATLLCYRCRYVTHVYTWIFFLKNLGKYYRLLFLYIINCSFLVIIFRIHKLLTRLKHYLVMFSFGIVYRIGLPFEVSLMINQNTAAILTVEIWYSKIFILLCQETLSCKLISLSNTCYWFIVNAIEAYKKMVWVVLFAQEQMPWVQMKVPVFLQLFLLKTLWLSDISGCFSTCFWTWYI